MLLSVCMQHAVKLRAKASFVCAACLFPRGEGWQGGTLIFLWVLWLSHVRGAFVKGGFFHNGTEFFLVFSFDPH